jgi:hypothetical protein
LRTWTSSNAAVAQPFLDGVRAARVQWRSGSHARQFDAASSLSVALWTRTSATVSAGVA